MSRKSTSTEATDKSQQKIWIWSAVGLLITNLVVVAIVAFLIHRDSVLDAPSQTPNLQRQF